MDLFLLFFFKQEDFIYFIYFIYVLIYIISSVKNYFSEISFDFSV